MWYKEKGKIRLTLVFHLTRLDLGIYWAMCDSILSLGFGLVTVGIDWGYWK